MTENKRFELAYEKGNWWAVRDGDITLWKEEVIHLLNELSEENEQLKQQKGVWKQSCCSYSNFNSILLHELDIAREQGFEVSNPFKRFLEDRGDVE